MPESDAGPSTSDADTFDASAAKKVFLTMGTIRGGSGGDVYAAAEEMCRTEAKSAGLTGTFVPWLSDATSDAIDNVTGEGPWALPRGPVVFVDRRALLDGRLAHVIDANAAGSLIAHGATVWTGTDASGRKSGTDCRSWSASSASEGTVGDPTRRTDGGWTNAGTSPCDVNGLLICFGV